MSPAANGLFRSCGACPKSRHNPILCTGSAPVARTLHCTVVEVPAMTDPFDARSGEAFRDLIPWADPYIAALMEKLRQAQRLEPTDELPPPLSGNPDRELPWQADWSQRNWPRE